MLLTVNFETIIQTEAVEAKQFLLSFHHLIIRECVFSDFKKLMDWQDIFCC